MSDPCQDRSGSSRLSLNPGRVRGFTLLEVLIVLALVGMLAAVSLPQFSVIQERLAFTLSRDTFENELNSLSYSAYKQGRPMILAGTYPRRPGDPSVLPGETDSAFREVLFLQPGQLKTMLPLDAVEAKFDLPENWRLTIADPIVYQASGYCSGGTIQVNVGGARYTYDLKAPTCAVKLAE